MDAPQQCTSVVSSLAQAHATCSAGHNEEKKPMFRTFMISAASTAVVAFSPVMFAQQGNSHGTPEEAKGDANEGGRCC